jgi:hypothetical protein
VQSKPKIAGIFSVVRIASIGAEGAGWIVKGSWDGIGQWWDGESSERWTNPAVPA